MWFKNTNMNFISNWPQLILEIFSFKMVPQHTPICTRLAEYKFANCFLEIIQHDWMTYWNLFARWLVTCVNAAERVLHDRVKWFLTFKIFTVKLWKESKVLSSVYHLFFKFYSSLKPILMFNVVLQTVSLFSCGRVSAQFVLFITQC